MGEIKNRGAGVARQPSPRASPGTLAKRISYLGNSSSPVIYPKKFVDFANSHGTDIEKGEVITPQYYLRVSGPFNVAVEYSETRARRET